jgi:hypothetical protein
MAMAQKRFYSTLFQRYVEPNEKYYWKFVYAELLFKIAELEEVKCSCMSKILGNYVNPFLINLSG